MSKIIPVVVLAGFLGMLSGCASQPQAAKPSEQEQLAKAEADRRAAMTAADKAKADAAAARAEADRAKEEAARAKKAFRGGLNK